MIPYAVHIGDITLADLEILDQATRFLHELKEDKPGILSCHQVCKIWVDNRNPGTHITGKWNGLYDHSWIKLHENLILDLYPVAGVRPSLQPRLPFGNFYEQKVR